MELPIVQGAERLRDEKNGRAIHPTQKPERLLEIFIAATTTPKDIVLILHRQRHNRGSVGTA